MDDYFVNDVISLYKENKWREVGERYHDHPGRNRLLWVYPDEENFQFLRRCCEQLCCDRIVSVGCGSGLLEWMLTEATGVPVTGIEVDGAWWRCKYSPPTFIDLHVTPCQLNEATIGILTDPRAALLFCYFNNRPAFEDYLEHYTGRVLVIIGPGHGTGVHTDPKPFGDVSGDWKLYKSQEVRNSRDFIAVYIKNVPKHV